MKLFYKKQYVPNDTTLASNFFKIFPVIIDVLDDKKSWQKNINEKSKISEDRAYIETYSEKIKQKKKFLLNAKYVLKKIQFFIVEFVTNLFVLNVIYDFQCILVIRK